MLVSFLLTVVATGIIVLFSVYQKKKLSFLHEEEQLKIKFDKQILESRLEMQEQTMKKISEEIHDNIGQVLTLVKLNINSIDCDDPVSVRSKMANSSQLVGKAINDLRELARSLNTDTIMEVGLAKSIEYELDVVKKSSTYQIQLIETGEHFIIPHQHELVLFRIFQEVINNIIKHAAASTIVVSILYWPDRLCIEIMDNGKGFDVSSLSIKKRVGLGIQNIKNRAKILGGEYRIVSNLGKGTTVYVILPKPDKFYP